MSLLPTIGAVDQDTDFYKGVATQSVRSISGSTSKMVLDGTAGDRKTWTWSCWVKRSALGSAQIVFNVGVTGVDEIDFHFTAADEFMISDRGGHNLKTAQLFRDTGAWYHLVVVMDTVQSGVTFDSANALKLYVNGVRVTDYGSGTSLPDENDQFSVNHTRIHHIFTRNLADNIFNGYLSEMNLIDGIAVGETSGYLDEFGELKNGVWIPKNYSGSYGNNGFRLEFKETGLGTGADDTIGADTGGGNHHFDSSGVSAEDCNMPDCPENNFCTLNPLINGYSNNVTIVEGNLSGTGTADEYNNTLGTILMQSGKWYWEVTCNDFNNYSMIGIAIDNAVQTADSTPHGQTGVMAYGTQGEVYNESGSSSGSYTDFLDAEVLGMAVDLDSGTPTFKFYNGNSLQDTINLTAAQIAQGVVPFFNIGTDLKIRVNFGQDSSFAGLKTSGSAEASDGNSIGDFFYAPPSGYLALCTSNMEEPTIGPNSTTNCDEHCDTVHYSGNATDNTDISGLNFKPDLIWTHTKSTSNTNNTWTDSSRGVGWDLFASTSGVESNDTAGIKVFNSNGFRLGTSTNHNTTSDGSASGTPTTYASYTWKANGGSTTSHSAGDNSATEASVSQANTTAGFSIVTYTGDTSGHGSTYPSTFNHGLGMTPQMIIVKARAGTYSWAVFHEDMNGTTSYNHMMPFDTQVARNSATNAHWGSNSMTLNTNLFSIGSDNSVGANTGTYIAYLFASVEGFSKIGSFTGNASTDGTFVYTGFRPQILLAKSVAAGAWHLLDDDLDYNPVGYFESDDTDTYGDYSHYDLLSNGFKLRDNGSHTNPSDTVIYAAFAKTPFKYANAR